MKIKFSDSFAIGTAINDIVVPKELEVRIRTGIEWIDEALGGEGFTPSMVTMFTGAPGTGKTTALLSMAHGLVKNEAVVLYNTAEESLFQVKRAADRLRLRGFLVGGSNNIEEIIKAADEIRNRPENKGKPFFLMIDSLQCMDDGHFLNGKITGATPMRVMEILTAWCKENFTNVIVIGQVNKAGVFAGSNQLKHAIDAHLHLSWEKKDEQLLGHRKFQVEKNRFGGTGRTTWLSMGNDGFHVTAVEET